MIREFPAPLLFEAPSTEPAQPLTRRAARAAAAAAAAAALGEAMRQGDEVVEQLVFDEQPAQAESQQADEPVVEAAQPQAEHDAEGAASGVDEFEHAARLFAFTGAQTIVEPTPEPVVDDVAAAVAAHVAERGSRRTRGLVAFKRVAAASASVGIMGVVGLLTVGLTTPAEAVVASSDGTSTAAVSVRAPISDDAAADDDEAIQAYVAPSSLASVDLTRSESYSTMTMAELAAESGIRNVSNFFVNDPNAAIQWPFAVGVPITYGFGMRSGAMHQGVDFVPGEGSPIQAIADGTVRVASESGGGYGVHVIIDHVIDGELVSSHYAHMLYGSIEVTEGQQVKVGTVLGHTGNTGRSFGAHTHFEILLGGTTPIDPIPWLREHAGG